MLAEMLLKPQTIHRLRLVGMLLKPQTIHRLMLVEMLLKPQTVPRLRLVGMLLKPRTIPRWLQVGRSTRKDHLMMPQQLARPPIRTSHLMFGLAGLIQIETKMAHLFRKLLMRRMHQAVSSSRKAHPTTELIPQIIHQMMVDSVGWFGRKCLQMVVADRKD
jgi:hypothetical protein